MAKTKQTKVFSADFETTVDGSKNQSSTEVWASAIVEVDIGKGCDDTVIIDNSIDAFFARLNFMTEFSNLVVYFHNLKFDGSFIISYLLSKGYSTALDTYGGNTKWTEDKYMKKKSFKCTISDLGQWYTITIKNASGGKIVIKDSVKLLPFSVEEIGKAFQTKHKKLSMEYVGNRKAGGKITEEEKKYIANDVLVVKEALEIMFQEGLTKLTIGACCKDQYKKSLMECDLNTWFPSMVDITENLPDGFKDADEYIRKSYKGGWCYVKKGCANIVYENGITADVNSLYPSMMIERDYPVGKPKFWTGDYIPDEANQPNTLYFVRVKTNFQLREGFLPTVQIKGSPYYPANEWLESSDVIIKGKKVTKIKTVRNGKTEYKDLTPILTLTSVDFELLKKHYILSDTEILDGCYFYTCSGKILFGDYINKWAEVKKTSKGAKRTLAKLFLNNLYGKFSTKKDNNTKIPYLDENGVLKFKLMTDVDTKKVWYIPIGAFVTSWARHFTITAAQANYKFFKYADTDSIHCNCSVKQIKGIKIHTVNFSCWAIESKWDKAIFVRQKTYIEHEVAQDYNPDTNQWLDNKVKFNVKCAGMGKRPKQLVQANLDNEKIEDATDEEQNFLDNKISIEDFKTGLSVPSNLKATVIKGGTLLKSQPFIIR